MDGEVGEAGEPTGPIAAGFRNYFSSRKVFLVDASSTRADPSLVLRRSRSRTFPRQHDDTEPPHFWADRLHVR